MLAWNARQQHRRGAPLHLRILPLVEIRTHQRRRESRTRPQRSRLTDARILPRNARDHGPASMCRKGQLVRRGATGHSAFVAALVATETRVSRALGFRMYGYPEEGWPTRSSPRRVPSTNRIIVAFSSHKQGVSTNGGAQRGRVKRQPLPTAFSSPPRAAHGSPVFTCGRSRSASTDREMSLYAVGVDWPNVYTRKPVCSRPMRRGASE